MCIETCREGEEGQSQTPFSSVQCQDKRQWAKSGTQEVLFEHQETLLDCVSTGTGCSERLWGLLGDLICSCMDGYPALGVPAGAWVGPDGPRSLSEPQPHSDSEILCNSITHILPYL